MDVSSDCRETSFLLARSTKDPVLGAGLFGLRTTDTVGLYVVGCSTSTLLTSHLLPTEPFRIALRKDWQLRCSSDMPKCFLWGITVPKNLCHSTFSTSFALTSSAIFFLLLICILILDWIGFPEFHPRNLSFHLTRYYPCFRRSLWTDFYSLNNSPVFIYLTRNYQAFILSQEWN